MTKVKFSPILEELSGKIHGLTFRRAASGRIYLSTTPDMSGVKWSEAQQAHRERFRDAAAHAKAAIHDPVTGPIYREAARRQNKRPYDLAISDYFKGKQLPD